MGSFLGPSITASCTTGSSQHDKMYARQMREGMAYKELAKAVTINILDFNYLNQTKNYHNVFHLYEDEERFQLTEALEMHFMELLKLISKWRRREVSPWEKSSDDPKVREEYLARRKAVLDEMAAVREAELRLR